MRPLLAISLLTPVLLVLALLVYTGWWQGAVVFAWQYPMLSWLPLLTAVLISLGFRAATSLSGANAPPSATDALIGSVELEQPAEPASEPGATTARPSPQDSLRWRISLAGGALVALLGLYFALLSPPAVGLDQIEYRFVDSLPERTQPRLLPRSGVTDDPRFIETKEIHLTRDPQTGDLVWTGEWQAASLSGSSSGISVKSLDDLVSESQIVRAGFDSSVSAIGPGTLKWRSKLSHPLSRTQYPVLIPTGERSAIAMAPYIGYRGFPFRTPYLKGVLVYHQDGTLEDLTPEQAAARPELVGSGRIVPEKVARAQAEALAASDELEGVIVDGKGNKQPFLTAIDRERTVWMTVINEKGRDGGVKAIVLSDSSTGETEIWRPSAEQRLISTRDVLDEARSLPLRWRETRCCDSDGHSYTVTLREVVEPRLAFKGGRPFYMVTVVPTGELALPRDVEYTLLIDARTGEKLDEFRHVEGGPSEDARLHRFFRRG